MVQLRRVLEHGQNFLFQGYADQPPPLVAVFGKFGGLLHRMLDSIFLQSCKREPRIIMRPQLL